MDLLHLWKISAREVRSRPRPRTALALPGEVTEVVLTGQSRAGHKALN